MFLVISPVCEMRDEPSRKNNDWKELMKRITELIPESRGDTHIERNDVSFVTRKKDAVVEKG